MGILFNTNTWRAPLQLIDCWLPAPAARPAPRPASKALATRAVRRFARAGWLGGKPKLAAMALPTGEPRPCDAAKDRSASRVRVLRQAEAPSSPRAGGIRLVISGRINDVCAELDRLAAQEK